MRNKIEEQDFRSVHGEMVQVWGNSFKTERKYHLLISITTHFPVLCERYLVTVTPYDGYLNSTYVIERPFSFTLIINDMKRILKKVFKSKKPSLGSIHGLVPATSTSTSTGSGATDLMLSVPACDSGTTSAQVAVGTSVSVQFRPSHL